MINERTKNLDLPLPHQDNLLSEDLPRLRESLRKVDAFAGQSQAAGDAAGAALRAEAEARESGDTALARALGQAASRTLATAAPLTGGGNLSEDRTIGILPATAATAFADGEPGSAAYAADDVDMTRRDIAATPALVYRHLSQPAGLVSVLTRDADYYVNLAAGDDANDGASPDAPFKTIMGCVRYLEARVYAGVHSVTVHVAAGIYEEQVCISRSLGSGWLRFVGEGLETRSIASMYSGAPDGLFPCFAVICPQRVMLTTLFLHVGTRISGANRRAFPTVLYAARGAEVSCYDVRFDYYCYLTSMTGTVFWADGGCINLLGGQKANATVSQNYVASAPIRYFLAENHGNINFLPLDPYASTPQTSYHLNYSSGSSAGNDGSFAGSGSYVAYAVKGGYIFANSAVTKITYEGGLSGGGTGVLKSYFANDGGIGTQGGGANYFKGTGAGVVLNSGFYN